MINKKLDQHIAAISKGYEAEEIFYTKERKQFPSRSVVIELVGDIRTLLFPGYFDNDSAAGDTSEHLLGERILHINRVMSTQIRKALLYDDGAMSEDEARAKAECITDRFLEQLPKIQELVLKDSTAAFEGDPAARSREEVILTYPGLYAVFVHRIAHVLDKLGVPLIPRLMSEHAHSQTGIDIGPGAQIGEYFFIDHGTGVVIGETTVIGDHAKIYQGVTLGATSTRKGQLLAGVKRHPTLGDYVTVYSNASVLGGDTYIGSRSVIGGSAFVTESVPEDARVSVKGQEITVKKHGEPDSA